MPEVKKVKIGKEEFVVRYTIGYMKEVSRCIVEYMATMSDKSTRLSADQQKEADRLMKEYRKYKDNKKKSEEILGKINRLYFAAQMYNNRATMMEAVVTSYELKYKLLSILLTQRDNQGNITREVSEEEVNYSDTFAEAVADNETKKILNEIINTSIEKFVQEIEETIETQKKMQEVNVVAKKVETKD